MRSKKITTIFGILVIFVVAAVTGVAVGMLFVDSIPVNIVMNMAEAELRDSDADVKKLVDKSKTRNPDSFTAVELYQIAEYNFNQKDAYYKTSGGYAYNMIGKQTLRSYKIVRDGQYLFDNLSPGQLDVITRVRHTLGTDLITRNTKGSWASGAKKKGIFDTSKDDKMTVKEYNEMFNLQNPLSNITYVISSKTCPKDSATKVSKDSNGNYTFKIKLNGYYLTAAACHYSYEIFYTSYRILTDKAKEKKILPAWETMEMEVVVDKNFDFVSISYDEKYKVNTKYGYQAVNDVFREEFFFDLDKIPVIEEVL